MRLHPSIFSAEYHPAEFVHLLNVGMQHVRVLGLIPMISAVGTHLMMLNMGWARAAKGAQDKRLQCMGVPLTPLTSLLRVGGKWPWGPRKVPRDFGPSDELTF